MREHFCLPGLLSNGKVDKKMVQVIKNVLFMRNMQNRWKCHESCLGVSTKKRKSFSVGFTTRKLWSHGEEEQFKRKKR